ncbi:MAG: transcription antitermination factor NusB [Candidatus Nanopelagicales bacterium]|nr:transcription antitermination factor NusB [Actinomycetota bacterium]HNE90207.1 transcription antitermination factor NusB [Actinomycetota bacterium]HNL50514.1 transcription antitermination factor NusB [Actinomycetota bacterium]HNO14701.1 transcription antitermination factor NusB [Actinomycetota bacterium]HUM86610.1 transcription antitermination factor NusB [Actinomycetota bacterium]
MAARSKARRRAVEALYESDLRSQSVDEALDSLASRMQTPVNAYTETIVRGVSQHRDQIDETLATYAQGWTLDRMPAVDRAILRVGAWEVLWGDVPDGVALAEAVGLANDLSTDESGKYINGVLARIKDVKPRLSLGE